MKETRLAPLLPMLVAQTRAQLTALWRVPMFSVTSLALPLMLFGFVGLPQAKKLSAAGLPLGAYLLASFGAYAVSSVMVFNFGISVAQARGQRLDLLQRATPLPPLVSIAAQVITALVFAFFSVLLLFLFGRLAAGIELPPGVWLSCIARLLFGSLPLIGLGFAIGYSTGPSAAPAVTNLLYLPMVFASGFFVPLEQLPSFIQRVAPFLPTFHYGQLAWNAVGFPTEPMSTALLWLAGYAIVFFAAAVRAYRKEEARKFA